MVRSVHLVVEPVDFGVGPQQVVGCQVVRDSVVVQGRSELLGTVPISYHLQLIQGHPPLHLAFSYLIVITNWFIMITADLKSDVPIMPYKLINILIVPTHQRYPYI